MRAVVVASLSGSQSPCVIGQVRVRRVADAPLPLVISEN